jgi:hypothetical protein
LYLPSAQAQAMGFRRKLAPQPKPTRDAPKKIALPSGGRQGIPSGEKQVVGGVD